MKKAKFTILYHIRLLQVTFLLAACDSSVEFNAVKNIASGINNLNTKSEIEHFIQKSDTNYRNYELKNLDQFNRAHTRDSVNKLLAKKLRAKNCFVKMDLDNNGYTDLLAIGDNHSCFGSGTTSCDFSPIVLMRFPGNKTKIINLPKEHGESTVPVIASKKGQPLLIVYKQDLPEFNGKIYPLSKTILTYKFDDLIEFNESPGNSKISKIEFNASMCFGSCPVFDLILTRDSTSVFRARHFNFSEDMESFEEKDEGIFSTQINPLKFNELEQIINYCNVQKLKNEYSVPWTDDQTATLKITYDNGTIKKIEDYGMIGTYGLKLLYEKMADIRFSEKWIKK